MKKLYDAYVKKHDNFLKTDIRNGRLWGRPHIEKILGYAREIGSKDKKGKVKTEFTLEPETYLLKSLEIEIQAVDDEGNIKQEFKPSQIMTQRTYKVVSPVDKVDNAQDGLVASLNQFGYVDMDHIVEIYGKSEEEIAAELGDKIYKNPLSGWETADEYLSGNVKKKLREAQERADYEPEYSRNVEALSKVIPKDVPFADITVNLGDGWVPFHITEAAVKNLLGFTGYRSDSSIKLEYSPLDNKWNLSKGTNYRNTAEMAGITAGVPQDPLAIVKIALNNTETIIKTTVDGKTFVNQEATNALKAKVKEIRQYLKEYLSADLDAMNEVEEIYNDKFNATVPRDYSKIAEYFTFPNMNPDVELRPHQKNAIVRALMGGNSLLAHGVGAGKTFEQIGIAMEAKRLGLANKPLLVVPNTKLTDFESDAKLLYPGAKVLALSQDDFEGNSIKRTLALAAVNDWDMVIVRHSSFSKIPVSPETELPALQAEIQELEAMLEEMTGERGFTVKKLQARLEKLRAKLHDYQENRVQYEGLLNFEDMGFDMLIVDEAHEYKNYPLTGKASSIKGLASGDADKARDMMIKSGYIRKLNGGNRGVVFGTGTPISNSMAEVFVMFKYLRPDLLREAGISHFDAWADAFSNITEVAEVSAKGEFRNKMQFKSFVNLPELITLFREFTDIKMQDTLNLPLPKHEIVKVECEAHPQLAEVMAQVEAQWADAIKSRQLFRLINIVLNAPQDIRLVIAGAINHSGSKVNKIANNVKEVYDKTAKEKGTQLIFATTGESSLTGFSLWTELETQLIKKGIPANEIAFIKTGTKEEELEEIYRKINAGKIRVAIGSFSKMGVGINVQERLFAIHELNAPYRPADIEQAEGRMIRQGNTYYDTGEKVRVYRYVTVGEEGAFSGDAFKWQILENKVKSINAVMKGDPSVRVLDAFDEDSYDAATMKAIAIGDERYIRKVELEGEIDVLRSSYNAYKTGLARAQRELTESRKKIRSNRDNIHNLQRALKTIEEMPPSVIEKQIVTIGGEKYTLTDKDSKKAADEAIKRYIAEYEAKPKNDSGRKQLANIQGMTLMYEQKYNNGFGSMIQGFALFADYYTNLMKVESRYVKLDKNNSSKDFLSLDKDNIFDAIFRKIKSFQREIDKMLKENDVLDKEVEKYEQILKQPFKHQEELDEKRAELREIDAALNIGTVAASGEAGSMDGGDAPATNTRQRRSGPRLKESTQTTEGAEAPIFYDPNEMLDELSEKLGRKMYAAPEAMEREDMQAAGIIANLLTQSQLIPMKGQDAPQGAAYGNNVFVSVETEDPHLYVAMHEIEHTLEDVDPEAHDEFMAIAKKYFNGAVGMSDYYFRHGYSYKDIWKEFTADVTAEIMQQPGFWAKVREQSPALIKKIVDIIDQIITKFRKEVAKDSSMLQYISDIEAFRDEVAGTMARSLQRRPRNLLDLRQAGEFAAKLKVEPFRNAVSDVTDTPEFKEWFKDSEVVGEDGEPLVVYHGSPSQFDVFDPDETNGMIWLASNKKYAEVFAGKDTGHVKELYASLQSPFDARDLKDEMPLYYWQEKLEELGIDTSDIDWDEIDFAPEYGKYEWFDLFPHAGNNYADGGMIEALQDSGHDGIIAPEEINEGVKSGTTYVAFSPEQVISARPDKPPSKAPAKGASLLDGVGGKPKTKFKHSKGSGFNLPNKHREVQDRMEGARGVPAETLRERMREIWDEVVRKSTREFEHLPHGGTYAELRNSLLLLRKQKGIAADKTLKVLNDITKPLNEYEYDVFSYKVIFDDLAHEFEENHLLPFGLTEENFEDIKDYIDEEAAKLPKVQEAIEKRRGAWNKAKNDYIQAQKAVGFNVEDRLKKEDYFRHQVLEYANGKGVMGSGKRLRVQTGRGFLRKRGGSTYDINTDYLQAEFEVMAQMIVDTASAGTVKVVKENHDIVKELRREAVHINDQGMLQEFQRLLDIMQDTETTPEQLYRRTLNRKQAIAYSQLYKLAAMGELPNGNGKWDQIIEEMSNAYWDAKEANANDESGEGGIYSARIPDEYQGQLMAYLNYLASQDESEVGKIKARTVFKGMAQKVKTIQKTLGTRYVTWEDLIPDGYTAWQPREGHMFFMADSIPQNMAEQLLFGIANEINIDATMLKKVMVAGQKYPELVIPDEVALTLETLYKDANQVGPVAKWLFHTPYRAWKQWQLISPRRFFKYNARNTTGDLDAVLAGNPSALRPKILKKAWDDLKQGFFSKDREYTRNLQGWFERGGFETLMQAQEINDINRNRQFRHLMESRMQKDLWEKAQSSPKTLWNGYWDTVRATTDFREALMRYACYLDYLEQMQVNHGIPKNFGASNREEVMALPDIRDRAAKLSNELLGAYDEVSVVGTWLADHLFPFWRWNEVNFVRYMRLGRNAWQDGQLCAATARKFTGLAIRSPLIAAKIGKFVLQATALTVMLNLWNMLFFGDEDKELPEDVRNRLHITFGRDSNGNILYFSRLGALQDFLDWFGMDTPVKTVQDFLSGRKSLLEIATDWGKADVNKVLNAITPFVKTPVELITDTKFYPDVFEAMPIRDRWQYLFDSFGLGNEYKAMAGKPTRGYGNSLYDLFYYRADPYETAYYKNKENVIKFRKKIGTYNEGYSESVRSDALYNIKLAMRYGDREAAEKYLLDYINKGGTAKGLSTSLKSLSPVYGLNETQIEVYIQNYLDVEGKENLAKAIDYHQRVIGGEMFEQD